MSDFLDEKVDKSSAAETEDGMLIIFPDENDDSSEEVVSVSDSDDAESVEDSFTLSFGKVNAARKEEEFSFLPFLNIPEVIDEEEDESDDGEAFSLSFGKVSAAKKERDYVYMPFLNVDENQVEEEDEAEEKEEEEDDSGIYVVGGDELFDLTPLKTRDSAVSENSSKSKSSEKSHKSPSAPAKKQNPNAKKSKNNVPQKKKQAQRPNAIPQKPNKVQQILAQMDPDIIASVSSDPRQMMMLEETIRSELIKQAAHNAVARELGSDVLELAEMQQKKRPTPQSKPRPGNIQHKNAPAGNSLNFSRQQIPKKKSNPISIVDTSSISEFGSEASQPIVQSVVQPQPTPAVTTPPPVQQITGSAASTPIIAQPVIVQPQITSQPVQQTSNAAPASATQQPTQRKSYTPTSPAAIRAAMKSGAISFDTPPTNQQTTDATVAVDSAQSAQTRKRIELQKQLGEKRSGCVIGAIALLMVIFIAIIALISGGDILTQCNYNEQYSIAQELVQQNKYEEAIEVLDKIKDYSQTAYLLNECYYALGKQHEESGEFEAAIAYYNSCIEYDEAIRSRLSLQKQQADDLRSSADESKSSEEYLNAYSLYVTILADLEQNPDITTDVEVKEVQNKSDSTRFTYAKLLFEEKNYSDAKVHFENLMLSSYAEADIWYYDSCYNLGRVYFSNGDYQATVSELAYFEDSRHGLDDESHANALACLALSMLYSMEDAANEETRTLQELFALLTEAHNGEIEEGLETEIKDALSASAFDSIKLIGLWENDDENYIVFENGAISFYGANEASDGLAEIYSDEVRFEDGKVIISIDGNEHVIMNEIKFDSTYQMAPQTMSFVNPYDGITYRMYRTR